MGLIDTVLPGGGAAKMGKNLLAKMKEKRALAKFNEKYNMIKELPGGNSYIKGYSSQDPGYSKPQGVSYEQTDLYPNIDLGFDMRITDRGYWSNNDLYQEDKSLKSIFLGEYDRYFRYSFDFNNEDSDNHYEDPTILGFDIMMDVYASPLFDFGYFPEAVKPKVPTNTNNNSEGQTPATQEPTWDRNKFVAVDGVKYEYWYVSRNGPKITLHTSEVDGDGVSTGKEGSETVVWSAINESDKAKTYGYMPNSKKQNPAGDTTEAKKAPEEAAWIPPKGSASYWFYRYKNMDTQDTEKRMMLLQEFKLMMLQIIPSVFPEKGKWKQPYYVTEIRGLEKLSERIVKYKEDKITLTLHEDVTLRTTYLAELYNNISYSYQHQRQAIPENCLRFDLIIKVADKRVFNAPKTSDQTKAMIPNQFTKIRSFYQPASNPYLIYTLHDCLFDFRFTQPHRGEIINGGFGGADSEYSDLKVDIFYKSISKEFKSDLIGSLSPKKTGSYLLRNKSELGIMTDAGSTMLQANSQFPAASRPDEYKVKITKGEPLAGTGLADRLMDSVKGTIAQVGDKIFDAVGNAMDGVFEAALTEGRKARGELISNLTDGITKGKFIPQMYPANVYDINLDGVAGDDLTNQSFTDKLAGFGKDLLARSTKGAIGGLNDLTSF